MKVAMLPLARQLHVCDHPALLVGHFSTQGQYSITWSLPGPPAVPGTRPVGQVISGPTFWQPLKRVSYCGG